MDDRDQQADSGARTSVLAARADGAAPGRTAGLTDRDRALVGRTVDGRYAVTGTIDRGGMATVYTAVDRRLDREVAVKVMHPSLAHDPDFVARFEREAKAAARINDPHVVAVTDTGHDGDLVFLVMELVRGRTLRALLLERGRLSPAQALEVLEPVLTALAAAARAGIVHRDVKPENVLLGDEGSIKVADFGLARAVEASGLTTHAGLLLGTVAYLPPEQVTNGRSDARGDVYAAGVVLFEMLTGAVPFTADTPISVAYKHVNETVPRPSASVGGVPSEVDDLVARATARDPDERFPDAAAFLAAVQAVRSRLAAAPSRRGDTLAIPLTEHLTEPLVAPVERPRPAKAAQGRRRRRLWPWVLAAVVLLSLVAGVLGWVFGRSETPHVPGLGNRDLAAYERTLTDKHIGWQVGPATSSDTVAQGLVLTTTPAPGAKLPKHTTVVITPSSGVLQVQVPDVRSQAVSDATAALAKAGLAVGSTTSAYSDTAKAGTVIDSDPKPGATVPHTTKVTLAVSQGPAPVTIPDVHGQPVAQAQQVLNGIGLKSATTPAYSDTVPAGVVMSQSPAPGQGHRGDTVALTVSQGPQMVAVPQLDGLSAAAAKAALQAAGLGANEVDLLGVAGHVVAQNPGAGKQVKHGTAVTFYTA